MMIIYHNPRCRKSRETLQLIEKSGKEFSIRLYLEDLPNQEELENVIKLLGIPAEKLLRKGEAIFKENFKGQTHTDEEWIKIMIENPKLIERPIVINGDKAVIGRPPENVLPLL